MNCRLIKRFNYTRAMVGSWARFVTGLLDLDHGLIIHLYFSGPQISPGLNLSAFLQGGQLYIYSFKAGSWNRCDTGSGCVNGGGGCPPFHARRSKAKKERRIVKKKEGKTAEELTSKETNNKFMLLPPITKQN